MLVSFREPIGAVTTTEMKPLGRKTNSLIRTARAAALREKTTRKKRLTDRARTFRKSGLDVQKNMRRPAAGAFFYLTSPFIGQCYIPRCKLFIFKGALKFWRMSGSTPVAPINLISITFGQIGRLRGLSFWGGKLAKLANFEL